MLDLSLSLPSQYKSIMREERHSAMTYAEAKEIASTIMSEHPGSYTRDTEADCNQFNCPDELGSWSGEICAIEVCDSDHNTIALIGYWV